jgi:hypothetical protein
MIEFGLDRLDALFSNAQQVSKVEPLRGGEAALDTCCAFESLASKRSGPALANLGFVRALAPRPILN